MWADQNLLMDYRGPTCFPVGRVENVIGDVQIYVGLYDITFSPLTEPNVCSNHASTNTERSIDFQYVRVLTEL